MCYNPIGDEKMKEFDKILLINNIKILAKQNNIKLGDLETSVNVSPGYFSRLKADDNSTVPSVEVIYKIACAFNVTVDSLIQFDYTVSSTTESYLMKILSKILSETNEELYAWKKDGPDKIMNTNDYGYYTHPLIKNTSHFDSYGSEYFNSSYCSLMDETVEFDIPGIVYHFTYTNKRFYISRVKKSNTPEEVYELYLLIKDKLHIVCTSLYSSNDLKKVLIDIWNAASEDVKKMKIDCTLREDLEDFLND